VGALDLEQMIQLKSYTFWALNVVGSRDVKPMLVVESYLVGCDGVPSEITVGANERKFFWTDTRSKAFSA
jgi:hypothetical protein